MDPHDSSSTILDPNIVGVDHYNTAREVQQCFNDIKTCKTSLQFWVWKNCPKQIRSWWLELAKFRNFFPSHFRGRTVHWNQGAYVPLAETIRSFKEILDGKHDDKPEGDFYMKAL